MDLFSMSDLLTVFIGLMIGLCILQPMLALRDEARECSTQISNLTEQLDDVADRIASTVSSVEERLSPASELGLASAPTRLRRAAHREWVCDAEHYGKCPDFQVDPQTGKIPTYPSNIREEVDKVNKERGAANDGYAFHCASGYSCRNGYCTVSRPITCERRNSGDGTAPCPFILTKDHDESVKLLKTRVRIDPAELKTATGKMLCGCGAVDPCAFVVADTDPSKIAEELGKAGGFTEAEGENSISSIVALPKEEFVQVSIANGAIERKFLTPERRKTD